MKSKALRKQLKQLEKQVGNVDVWVEQHSSSIASRADGTEVHYVDGKPKVVIW